MSKDGHRSFCNYNFLYIGSMLLKPNMNWVQNQKSALPAVMAEISISDKYFEVSFSVEEPLDCFRAEVTEDGGHSWEDSCVEVFLENPTNPAEYFNFETHLEMQENVIARHPETTFVVAHIGSAGEDLARVDAMMEKYPNMNIDIAARISELGRQPYSARKFFLKYPDRILFGTDYQADEDPEIFYPPYFRFLETFDEYFDYMGAPRNKDYGAWKIYGIGLPDDILRKVYSENAKRIFKL